MAFLTCHFNSRLLGMQCLMNVILPDPAASGATEPRHQTLFLLHGLSDDHTTWQRRTSIERYVADMDLAVVMPAVHRSFYTNTATGSAYFDFVSEEVPAVARSFFPLSHEPSDTFVAGLSMGGYGAFKLALSHPGRYAAAASLSGALDLARIDAEDEWRHVFGDPGSLPGSENDLFHLAKGVAEGNVRPRLYQWCGTEDFLYEGNVRFRDHAEALGLDLLYEEAAGDHAWKHWDRQIQRVLAWLPGARPRRGDLSVIQ